MSRSIDIVLRNGEVITVDVADLDPDPSTILDLLREGECDVKAWLRIAIEYWRLGHLDASAAVGDAALAFIESGANTEVNPTALPRIHALLANISLERAKTAPKKIDSTAQSDIWTGKLTKKEHYTKAAQDMNNSGKYADGVDEKDVRTRIAMYLTRANFLLSTRELDDALNAFEQVLNIRSTNIPALIGKARIFFVRKQYREALALFQTALTYKPNSKPDPRIGIGLCLWQLGSREKAKLAWQRSAEVHPDDWPAQLLLGLEAFNSSKDPARASEAANLYKTGFSTVQKVWKLNQFNAATTNVLADFFLRRNDLPKALKFAERTIQFADTLAVLTDGYIRAAQVAHSGGRFDDARTHYGAAIDHMPKNLLANLGVAQMQVQNDEILAAIHHLDAVITQSESDLHCLEALIMLASLRAYARPALSAADGVLERGRAKDLFDRIHSVLDGASPTTHPNLANQTQAKPPTTRTLQSVQSLRDDVDMHIEIAALWQRDNIDRATRALQEAIRVNSIKEKQTVPPAKLRCNLAVLKHLSEAHAEARALYEEALPLALADGSADAETSSVTILYNLARVYEDLSEYNLARDGYLKLLSRHPEYTDAKARLAAMRMGEKRYDEAHSLIKQALSNNDKNTEVRAFYIWLLFETHQAKPAKLYTFSVLKDDGHDVYALCAAGRLHFNEARESRDPSPAATAARKDNFLKAANIYGKALAIDPSCAMAAQGLAIMIAEDSLGTWAPGQTIDDAQFKTRNARNAREALEILAKVRESFQDGSVYINMGHCHFVRDEYDKAIENYETASKRFFEGQNISVLQYLARAWFAKANKIGSFVAMRQALKHSQMALHLQPNDKATIYNIAMIEQKAAELLFSLPPERRKLPDLRVGISHAAHAQKLFASLASDTARPLPYSQDVAQNRYKYGESMLRRSAEHVAVQEAFDAELRARTDAARRQRALERERLDSAAQARILEDQKKAEELAKRRKELRTKTEEWAIARRAESDEEDEKKARKAAARKARQEAKSSGDENVEAGQGRKERKRKPRATKAGGRKGRRNDDDDEPQFEGLPDGVDEDDAVFSADDAPAEDGAPERPKKSRLKKRAADDVPVDDDDGPSSTAPSAKRKKIKSKEIIDSDDDA